VQFAEVIIDRFSAIDRDHRLMIIQPFLPHEAAPRTDATKVGRVDWVRIHVVVNALVCVIVSKEGKFHCCKSKNSLS
jgi:hypothetical protein